MTNLTVNTRIILRNDTKANWESTNPILLKGELGLEIDTGLFKFGNSVDVWDDLDYANESTAVLFPSSPDETDWDYPVGTVSVDVDNDRIFILADNTEDDADWKEIVTMEALNDMLSALNDGDMLKSEYAANGAAGKVDYAEKADKLAANREIELTGDVTGEVDTNLSGDVSISTTLATVLAGGAASGLYKVTVNEKGLVTAVTLVQASDIPDMTLSKITDAGTAAYEDIGASAGNVVIVETTGYINESLIPPLHIVEVWEVDAIAEMLILKATKSDMCIVNLTTGTEVYILLGTDPTDIDDWRKLNVPTGAVLTVNGLSGAVTLTTTNIDEGINLYYTEARATANFEANFEESDSTDLADGDTILHTTDILILNGGNATI